MLEAQEAASAGEKEAGSGWESASVLPRAWDGQVLQGTRRSQDHRPPGKEAWVPDSPQKEPRLPTTPSTGPLTGTPKQAQQKDIKVDFLLHILVVVPGKSECFGAPYS